MKRNPENYQANPKALSRKSCGETFGGHHPSTYKDSMVHSLHSKLPTV